MTKTVRVYGTVIETIEREVAFTVEVPAKIEALGLNMVAAHANTAAEWLVVDGFSPDVVHEETLRQYTSNDYGEPIFNAGDIDFSGLA